MVLRKWAIKIINYFIGGIYEIISGISRSFGGVSVIIR